MNLCNAFALSFWINFLFVKCHAITEIFSTIMDEFKIYQPIIIGDMLVKKEMTNVVKNLNQQGYSVGFKKEFNQHQSSIIFTHNITHFKWNNATHAPILVVSKMETEEDLKEVDVSIGSEVLFLDWDSQRVYESYTINKVQVTRYLGHVHTNDNSKAAATFVPSKDYISNMENRRCNFYGMQVTGAIFWLNEDPGHYSNLVEFFPNNDTYDITKLANNPKYYEKFWTIIELKILKIMEHKFNFTSKLFLRRDMKTGSPHILSNGSTVIGEGVFQNLVEGSIEFVWDTFTMSPIRLQFVDFLPILWSAHDAIFIPIKDSSEEIDWNVFFKLFAIEVWIAILIKCITFTILVSIIEWFHDFQLVSP